MRKYYFKLFPVFFVLISSLTLNHQVLLSKDINHYRDFLINNEKGHAQELQEKDFIRLFFKNNFGETRAHNKFKFKEYFIDFKKYEYFKFGVSLENINVTNESYLIKRQNKKNNDLIIYIGGHSFHPFKDGSIQKIINNQLFDDFDFLVHSLPMTDLYEFNNFEFVTKNNKKRKIEFANDHSFFGIVKTNYNLLSFFIDPVVKSANYFIKKNTYNNVILIGESGGGLISFLSAPLIKNVSHNFTSSGVSFFNGVYESSDLNFLDLEQLDPIFFKEYLHEDVLNLSKSLMIENHFFYNQNDKCCFDHRSYKVMEENNTNSNLKLYLINSHDHGLNDLTIDIIAKQI